MKKYIFLLPAAALLFAACTKEIEQRLDKLESDVTAINASVKALQDKVNSAVTVTKVETNADGYTITFSDNTTATIKNGDTGKSAYEVAKAGGYTGTEAQWLESLKVKGDQGKSAYDLAVEGGYTGTQADWLKSLTGAQGKSAYEVAKDNGYTGTEAQWLESLKGAQGDAYFDSFAVVGNTVEIVLAGTTDKIVLPVYSVKISSVTFVPDFADGAIHADYASTSDEVIVNYQVFPEETGRAIFEGVVTGVYKLTLIGNTVTKALNGKKLDIPVDAVYSPVNKSDLEIDLTSQDFINFGSNSVALLIENTITGEQFLSSFVNVKCEQVTFVLGGVTYNIVKMKDGKFWMAENLRYLPDGMTACSDVNNVAAGVYMPVVSDGTKAVFGTEEDIATRGYLYQAETALGVPVNSITTMVDAKALEGTQGICAKGWHIPTIDDITGLVGKALTPIVTNTSAPYFSNSNGSVMLLNEDGMNVNAYGSVSIQDNTKTSGTLMGVLSNYTFKTSSGYFIGSTTASATFNKDTGVLTNVQFWGLMPMTNKALEADYTCNGTKVSYKIAASVRCVRD